MIKAVVVDDERLVRKGFISLIDWASLGIVIVGEAGDGKSALELLQQRQVDLLFVDITMPGMSGFDLIREVRHHFPYTNSVVLTCHHEFEYVQEALRLGAVDYIVKTLLEIENADEVMRRIVDRIKWEESHRTAQLDMDQEKRLTADSALLFYPLISGTEGMDKDREKELFQLSVVRQNPLLAVGNKRMCLLVHHVSREEWMSEVSLQLGNRWQTVLLTGIRNQPLEPFKRELEMNLAHQIFYAADPESPVILSYEELREAASISSGQEEKEVWEWAQDMKWAVDRAGWESFIHQILRIRPRPDSFASFARSLCQDWEGMLLRQEEAEKLQAQALTLTAWVHWKAWFRHFADHAQLRMVELSLSKEVMLCLIKAIRYMNRHTGHKINQEEVAAHVNMSRSYFSQCFARFAGETFGEKLRNLRLEAAKSLLLNTGSPVYEIASLAGFEDARYFCKLFRQHVGMLPSDFRHNGGKE